MHSSDTLVVKTERSVAPPDLSQRGRHACGRIHPEESGRLPEYLRILSKQRWIVAGCIVAALLLTLIASLRATRKYEARSRIAILKDTSATLGLKETEASSGEDWDYTVTLDTQSGILKSGKLILQVIRELKLDRDPRFAKHSRTDNPDLQPDAAVESALLTDFMKGLKVTPVMHTRLLEVRYISPDPRLSANIVNTLVKNYIEQDYRTRFETTMQTSDWLARQLGDLRARVETSQAKLVEYQRKNNILGLDEKQNIVTSRLDELNRELTLAQASRIEKEAIYRNALVSNPELSIGQKEHGIPEPLRMRYAELKQQFAKLTTEFGPAYPRVVELKNELDQVKTEIESERTQIARRLSLEYQTASRREEMLAAAFNAQKQEANRLNQSAIEYNILKRDAETNRQLYEGLLQKLKEASVTAGLRSSNVRVVDPARVPARPVSPNVPMNLALGLLVGAAVGVAAAFGIDTLDNTIRTPEEAQFIAGLPALGVVPLESSTPTYKHLRKHSKAARDVELISQHEPQSPLAESYRALRTSIVLSSPGSRPRVLLVTSSLPREGKTTTAINTATVLAQTGARVLLVDADLRRPAIHTRFGLAPEFGLSTLLSGGCDEEEAITSSSVPGLSLLQAGPNPPRPAELLGSSELAGYVAGWRRAYDYVLFDSCPVLSVTDAVLLSVIVDSVLLVIRSGTTTRDDLRRSCDLLLRVNANLLGCVVNAADLRGPEYQSYSKHCRYYTQQAE